MSHKIEQLTAADFEETMQVMNLSFATTGVPHDFARMFPSLYRPTDEDMGCNFALRRDGRIRAVVGVFPLVLRVADRDLRIAGIGGVSTHPECRGEGMMTVLMQHCLALIRQQSYALSYLGGQRQRYLYFGYEWCGQQFAFTVNKANVRPHRDDSPEIHFEPLEADDARLQSVEEIQDGEPVYCRRPSDKTYATLCNWYRHPYAATDEAGRMVGYLVAAKESNQVTEIVAVDDTIAAHMIGAWVERQDGKHVAFNIGPGQCDLMRRVAGFCEASHVSACGNWQIFDWVLVIDALMQLRRNSGPMAPGLVVVAIDDRIHLRLEVDDDECRCTSTDSPADVKFDAATAMRVLFGPLAPSQTVTLARSAVVLEQWCPLPLSLPRQDMV